MLYHLDLKLKEICLETMATAGTVWGLLKDHTKIIKDHISAKTATEIKYLWWNTVEML